MPTLRALRKFFIEDRIILTFLVISIIVNVIAWAFILWKTHVNLDWRTTTYNVYRGATGYGPPQTLFEIPGVGTLIVLMNGIISYFLHKRNNGYAEVLMGATAFLQVLLLIPLLAIYYFGNII